jgi:hypothetical protein
MEVGSRTIWSVLDRQVREPGRPLIDQVENLIGSLSISSGKWLMVFYFDMVDLQLLDYFKDFKPY